MNNKLNELSVKELSLLKEASKLNKDNIDIENSTIPVLYKEIFMTYSKMNTDIEALKRAIFIQWYAVSEPVAYSGIEILDENIERDNLEKVIDLILNKNIDNEFLVMLYHYYCISDWYFDSFFDFQSIFINVRSEIDITNIKGNILETKNRGQMGYYWASILG